MTIHKPIAVTLMLLLAGVVPAALSGCDGSRNARAESVADSDDSGPVNIHKMGGGIDVNDAPRGANLETMGGDIHLGNVGDFAKVKTMGGNVTIDRADASVDASTMGGNIKIKDANGSVKATTMGGDVSAHVVGSSTERRDVYLSSMAGTITLTVPKDFPMEIRIKLAYTRSAGNKFDISEHLGLTRRETADWDTSMGSPRKYIYATGRVGDGQNHVEISTINGDVILRQE
jgi:DUF4097 and DUF4098 domain-containing protein YvlB